MKLFRVKHELNDAAITKHCNIHSHSVSNIGKVEHENNTLNFHCFIKLIIILVYQLRFYFTMSDQSIAQSLKI